MEVNNNICKSAPKKNFQTGFKHKVLYSIPAILALLFYSNSLNGDFVHDDIFAIKNNPDVNGKSSVLGIWKNDFWGKSIFHETSHKSYRPIATLTFRLNYELSGGQPFAFHVVNVLLHCLATWLFSYLLHDVFHISFTCSFASSLLFAVHPIHTEAVSGIVGRADVLCAVFFLLTIIFYKRCIEEQVYIEDDDIPITSNILYLYISIITAIIATLCKEHGIMVVPVCIIIDCCICSKKAILRLLKQDLSLFKCGPLIKRILSLICTFSAIVAFRLYLNGGHLPTFLEQDNPASFSSSFLTRMLTFNYLLVFNVWLLLAPSTLCYDWQIGSIPLVESVWDIRNMATVIMYMTLVMLVYKCCNVFKSQKLSSNACILGMAILILPFIPASNIFVTVGFVVAERILYISSFGFCLLIGYGFSQMYSRCQKSSQYYWISGLIIYLTLLATKTVHRNQVWHSRESLFWSGVVTVPHNAKVHYNYGNYLKDMNEISKAIEHYQLSLELYPSHASAHNNLGTLLKNDTQAEHHFKEALKYHSKHKGALVNLANIYQKYKKTDVAESLLTKALTIDSSYHLALISMSKLLMETGRVVEAEEFIERALRVEPQSADAHNFKGAYLHRTGKFDEAVRSYITAYSIDTRSLSSLTNAAYSLRGMGRIQEAEELLTRAMSVKPTVELENQLGLLYYKVKDIPQSLHIYENILKKFPNYTEAATNYAKILSSENQLENASYIAENVLLRDPMNIGALQVMGTIYAKKNDHQKAISYLRTALEVITSQHVNDLNILSTITFHLGHLYFDIKDFTQAMQYFQDTVRNNPQHIQAYLRIGGIYHIKGNYVEARKFYNKILQLDPTSPEALENIKKLNRLEKKVKSKQ